MNDVVAFDFNTQSVRVITRDGEPWFVAADVGRVLDINNPAQAVTRLDDDEKGDIISSDVTGRRQQMTIINESGLYKLIFTSRKPEAAAFRKWVTSVVLPSIRKTGAYISPTVVGDDLITAIAKALSTVIQTSVDPLKARIKELETALPSATTHTTIMGFANLHGIPINIKTAARLGRMARAISVREGRPHFQVKDERFGMVWEHEIDIVRTVFQGSGLIN